MPLAHLDARGFVALAVVFHTIVSLLTIRLALRWYHQPAGTLSAFFRGLTRDVGALLGVAVTLGLGSAMLMGLFTLARLVGQVLFAELIALLLWIAWMQRRTAHGAAFALTLALGLMGAYWEGYRRGPVALRVERHTLTVPAPLLQAGSLRILHITDIQTDRIGAHQERAIRAGMAENPDLVVLTGDYVYGARAAADLRALFLREKVTAPLGVYAVEGDLADDGPEIFVGLPVRWLADSVDRIPLPTGGHLSLIGLSRRGSRGGTRDRLLQLVNDAASDLVMVMGHSPDYARTLVAGGAAVDLALAGHTHGGQVVLPFLGPPVTLSRLPRRYAGGLNDYEGIPLHVSRGVGMEGGTAPRVRFLCPPEVCVIEVRWPGKAPLRS